jgi:hypothetical protein
VTPHALTPSPDAPVAIEPDAPYEPCVGDVVEFEKTHDYTKGLVFQANTNRDEPYVACAGNFYYISELPNLKRMGFCPDIVDVHDISKAKRVAKAYFSTPAEREFKVGDKVRVVKWFGWQRDYFAGEPDDSIKTVTKDIDSGGDVRLKGPLNDCFFQGDCLELVPEPTFTGSYAERQKQWIEHHGLKVGSKVKVVRKATFDEQGWGMCWNTGDKCIGKEYAITGFADSNMGVTIDNGYTNTLEYFPYFCLEVVR